MRAQRGLSLIKCISQFKVRQEISIFLLRFYQNGCSRHMAEQWHRDLFVPSDLFLLSPCQSYEKPVMMRQLQTSHLLQPFFFSTQVHHSALLAVFLTDVKKKHENKL